MPFQLGMKKLPSQAEIEAEKQKKNAFKVATKTKKVEAKAKKDATKSRQRRSEMEAMLFGSELFEPIARKEKEIIITFRGEQTKQGLHISKCGKFAYETTQSDFYFNLYYFLDVIMDYSEDIEIIPSDRNWLFGSLTCAELEECAIKLKRAEYADEKQKLLDEIKEQERLKQLENDRIDTEFEAEQEQQNLLDLSETSSLDCMLASENVLEKEWNTPEENLAWKDLAQPTEPTLDEQSAIEAKIKQATEEIKPKSAFIPLVFKKG